MSKTPNLDEAAALLETASTELVSQARERLTAVAEGLGTALARLTATAEQVECASGRSSPSSEAHRP